MNMQNKFLINIRKLNICLIKFCHTKKEVCNCLDVLETDPLGYVYHEIDEYAFVMGNEISKDFVFDCLTLMCKICGYKTGKI